MQGGQRGAENIKNGTTRRFHETDVNALTESGIWEEKMVKIAAYLNGLLQSEYC